MGRERIRQWQHFCVRFALLILFGGCSLLQDAARFRDLRQTLSAGEHMLAQGEYDGSLRAFESVATKAQDKPLADAAIYHVGLVYAHPEYANRNLQKAIGSFKQLIERYPDSPWVEQARIWVGVLTETSEAKQQIESSRRVIEKSREELERNRLALERSLQEVEKSRLELEKSKQEIEKTKQVLEKSKQIDIEIEQKRRDRGR